jgi:N-acetyl-gamma-glutamyl-phosphate reductase
MIRAAVVGASGYAGAELVRILSGHSRVSLTVVTSRQYAGAPYDSIYPALSGFVRLNCDDNDPATICKHSDVVFLALPHKVSMGMVPALLDAGKRVVDLSADFRFKNRDAYEAYYQPHSCAHLMEQSVYGLCERYGDQVAAADLVGNPGCYPTSVLLPLLPLVEREARGPGHPHCRLQVRCQRRRPRRQPPPIFVTSMNPSSPTRSGGTDTPRK